MAADWSIGVGILIFIIALVVGIKYFISFRKFSVLFLTAGIATFLFGIFYSWDIFQFERNVILAVLIVATLIMFVLGLYFKNVNFEKVNKK
mgnify:CR=1 FL=1